VYTSPVIEGTSDAALLVRIRDGDAVALATAYRRHGAVVFRFACLHAPSRDAAADATQETFLWLSTQGATGFDPARSSLAAFLCGVVRNQSLRIRAAEARFVEMPEDTQRDQDHEAHEWGVGEALAHLLARERGEALLTALATLPAEQREVIALVEFEDFSYADAATVIGCPIGTVRSRLSRAKQALRTRLLELFPVTQRISV
jgi:RNA polymerase sigma-70 factor (ECF subfamily)